jgi:hypothetical protein
VARRLKFDVPGPDRRVGFEELRERGVAAVFAPELPAASPLVVELGFGRGEFLLALAAEQPARAFLGVEYSGKRVLKMTRRLARASSRTCAAAGAGRTWWRWRRARWRPWVNRPWPKPTAAG